MFLIWPPFGGSPIIIARIRMYLLCNICEFQCAARYQFVLFSFHLLQSFCSLEEKKKYQQKKSLPTSALHMLPQASASNVVLPTESDRFIDLLYLMIN